LLLNSLFLFLFIITIYFIEKKTIKHAAN